jgi:hypothetical protein
MVNDRYCSEPRRSTVFSSFEHIIIIKQFISVSARKSKIKLKMIQCASLIFEIFLLAAIRGKTEIMRKTEMAREKEIARGGGGDGDN